MRNIVMFFALSLSVILGSCSGINSGKAQQEQVLEHGKVMPKVTCKKDVTHSYALYLPSGYAEGKLFPLIILFDAHGNGNKAVELFKEQAEKYGYILVGSNVSKNGTSWEATAAHYDILLADVLERFGIDKGRIYTCGFSGGSRVASTVAITKGGIAGVIGCSAGFPQVKEAIKYKFDFFGFAGNDDMNYAEMVNLDRALEKSGFRHQLVVFNGTHDWPPKENIPEAMLWLELNAMRNKLKPIDKNFITTQLANYDKQLVEIKNAGSIYEEYLFTKKIINYFKDLTDTKKYEERFAMLKESAAVKKGMEKEEANDKKELMLQQQYAEKLSTENAAWWKSEVNQLNEFVVNSRNESERHLIKRVLEYLSLMAFSTCNSLYSQNNFEEAEHYIELYALIDSDNPEPEFMYAQVCARKKDNDNAMLHLKRAAELGFSDKGRIDNDTIFMKYNADKRFAEAMETINSNQKKQ